MTKLLALLLLSMCFATASFASHLKGGWVQYEYLGPGGAPNTSQFKISVHQYLACNSGLTDAQVNLGIFNLDKPTNNSLDTTITIDLTSQEILTKTSFDPCINNPPVVCYEIDHYVTIVELPDNGNGYTFTVQRCCRIGGIINVSNSASAGVSYTTTMPGSSIGAPFFPNNSAVFQQLDTAVVCHNTPFTFDFSASDPDGDSLSYSFTAGIDGTGGNTLPNSPSAPPYPSVTYQGGFTGISPMGAAVTINTATGLVSGTAPNATGDYVVAVMVSEYRNGQLVGMTRKELHITVANCSLSAAALKPKYLNCNDLSFTFSNQSTASNIVKYLWTFGDTALTYNLDTSHNPTPTHIYSDTGMFTLKLVVTSAAGCLDSTTSLVKAYPGFKAGFAVSGSCLANPYQFTDTSHYKYGNIIGWRWNFGEATTLKDTSSLQDPSYTYPATGTKTIQLIATSDKECIDTATYQLTVIDKPTLSLPFKDTIICDIDTIGLQANGTGDFTWTPIPNGNTITQPNTNTPDVFPKSTTKYAVEINHLGCVNNDTVTVNVLPYVIATIRPDTIVCQTDTFRLHPVSTATVYSWTASTGEVVAPVKYPLVKPLTNTTYSVTTNPGQCQYVTNTIAYVYPYPVITATPDTGICVGTVAQLHAKTTGDVFTWTPTTALFYPNTLNPIAAPSNTMAYILTVADTTGCLKSVTDTIVITVVPKVVVDAGRDTVVIVNQPLQLFATSNTDPQSTTFTWTPVIGLDNPSIPDPIATLGYSIDSITYTVRATESHGCYGEDDITVIVYKIPLPEIYVPTGFTPNNDGKNDVLRPTTVGIASLSYFRVFNRLGQLLFSTSEFYKGWDGTFAGIAQPPGAYVFEVLGLDYLGKPVFRKGTSVLIR